MCLLIVLRGVQPGFPVVVAANRDERKDRQSSPPGLWVGARHRVLSPRDRLAGGTWLGVNDRGVFAGITNVAGAPPAPGAPSRGHLPHVALDEASLAAGVAAVQDAVRRAPAPGYGGFQLVLADAERTAVLRHVAGQTTAIDWSPPVLVVSNEHAPGQLDLPALADAVPPALALEARLQVLRTLLGDRGGNGRHAVCKHGDTYGTVSSSLLALAAAGPEALVWRYAAGPPDVSEFRNYGNLGRRLTTATEDLPTDRHGS